MAVVKVMGHRQVVIPKEIFEQLGLQVGDYLEARVEEGRLVYVPKKLVDRDAWYASSEGQKRIQEALDDLEAGRTVGPFETVEDAREALRRQSQ